jgi:hypothetical protein
MTNPVHLSNGGNGQPTLQRVDPSGAAYVIMQPYPPIGPSRTEPFRQYLTTDGTPGGSNDMGIDGSSTNVDFYVPASPTKDRYITGLSILVGYGTAGQPYQWANGTALSNGSYLFYTDDTTPGIHDIHEAIKTNQDMFRLYLGLIPTSWEVRGVGSNNDFGYFIFMDMKQMGLPFGIKLNRGSSHRLTMRIRDNAGTDADVFNCITYGFERFE